MVDLTDGDLRLIAGCLKHSYDDCKNHLGVAIAIDSSNNKSIKDFMEEIEMLWLKLNLKKVSEGKPGSNYYIS